MEQVKKKIERMKLEKDEAEARAEEALREKKSVEDRFYQVSKYENDSLYYVPKQKHQIVDYS